MVELFNPVYDEATHTVTYDIAVLGEWENAAGMGFTETPTDLAAPAPTSAPPTSSSTELYCPDPDMLYITANESGPTRPSVRSPTASTVATATKESTICGPCDRWVRH